MGVPPNLLFGSLNLKTMENFTTRSNNQSSNNEGSLCTERVKVQRQTRRKQKHLRKTRKVLMKRRRSIFRRKFDENGIETKVQTLQRLVPSCGSDNQGLEGLFTDTASYIISLQMRVRVMQIMVDVLENSQDHK